MTYECLVSEREKPATCGDVKQLLQHLRSNGKTQQSSDSLLVVGRGGSLERYGCTGLSARMGEEQKRSVPVNVTLNYLGDASKAKQDFAFLSDVISSKHMSVGVANSTDESTHAAYPKMDDDGIKFELPQQRSIFIAGRFLTKGVLHDLAQKVTVQTALHDTPEKGARSR